MTWKCIGWLLIVYQVDRMIVDSGALGELCGGVWRGDIDVFQILNGDRDGDILVLQDRATKAFIIVFWRLLPILLH